MLQWLATWSMQSQRRATLAIAATFATPLLFWIGAALSALVLLRHGTSDGSKVVLWGCLPAFAWWAAGDPTAVTILGLTFLAAYVVRATSRMDWALCALGLVGSLSYFVVPSLYGDAFPIMVDSGQQLVQQSVQGEPEQLAYLQQFVQPAMQGGLATLHALVAILCLFLGRYWQSFLDYPGGFGQEFRQLRLPLSYSVPVIILALGAGAVQPQLACIMLAATVPLLMAGLAIIHGAVNKTGAGTQWLVITYAACFFVGAYMYTLLIFVATLDGFIDIRARLKDTAPNE